MDEYYLLVGVESILAHGFPEPPGGGFYVRGLPLQYLTAGFVSHLDPPEFALRLPAVLLGLAAVGAAFVYGRRVHGPTLGLALAGVLLVSSWSIEFSRFGRMYAAFQLITLLFLVALHWVLTERPSSWFRYLPHVLCVLAVLTHALGMFLVPLLLLPAALPDRSRRLGGRRRVKRYLGVTGAVMAVLLAYHFVPFREIGVGDPLPPDGGGEWEGPALFRLPAFPFWSLGGSDLVTFAVVMGMVGFSGAATWLWARARWDGRWPLSIAAMALVAAALHQLLVAAALGVLLLARYRIHVRPRNSRTVWGLFGAAAALSVMWLAFAISLTYGWGARGWLYAADATVFRDGVAAVFFGWPRLHEPLVQPWMAEMPLLASLLALGVVADSVRALGRPLAEAARSPGLVTVYVLVLLGTLDSLYETTRYTYFIYPVALAALFISVHRAVGWVAARTRRWPRRHAAVLALSASVGAFAVSEDFNVDHLVGVGTPEVLFRTGAFEERAETWYPRKDHRSPGRFVEREASSEARVVVMDLPPVSYYVARDHAVYLPRHGDRFPIVARDEGTRDYWSGMRLLGTPEELATWLAGAPEAWLIRRTAAPAVELDDVASAMGFASRWPPTMTRKHLSTDGRVEVVRMEVPAPAALNPGPRALFSRAREVHSPLRDPCSSGSRPDGPGGFRWPTTPPVPTGSPPRTSPSAW